MLHYAFEELKVRRVHLNIDNRNIVSQNSIMKYGAKKEGVLR